MNWEYFVLGVIAWQILKMGAQAVNREIVERRQKRFLRAVKVFFPDNSEVKFIALDASDKRTMAKLERVIREQLGLTEDQAAELVHDEDVGADRDGAGTVRSIHSRRRQKPPQ